MDVSALSSLSSQDECGLGRASENGIGSDDEEQDLPYRHCAKMRHLGNGQRVWR